MYKRPVSTLVVIYAQDVERVLMLQWRDDLGFWQSTTGSVEGDETAPQAAMREVGEEVTTDVVAEQLTLIGCQRTVEFEISSYLRHHYVPDMTRNMGSWFCLAFPHKRQIAFTKHPAYKRLDASTAAALTKSWSSRQAIEQFIVNTA